MASHASAEKKYRRDVRARERNRQHRSRLRTQVKKFRKAVDSGDLDAARSMLPATLSLVDRTAKLGVIHDNTAARTKSRLTKAVARAAAPRS